MCVYILRNVFMAVSQTCRTGVPVCATWQRRAVVTEMSRGLRSPKRSVCGPLRKCAGSDVERAQTLSVQLAPFLQTPTMGSGWNQRPAPPSGPRGPSLKGPRILTLAVRLRVPVSAPPAAELRGGTLVLAAFSSCGWWAIHVAVCGSTSLLLMAVLRSSV